MKIKLLVVFLLLVGVKGYCQTGLAKYMQDSLGLIEARIKKQIIPARYMEGKLIETLNNVPNWVGTPVSVYEYSVDNGKLKTQVYLANADAKRMAAWVISTCVMLTNNLQKKHTDLLIKAIRSASGGQFPVKGIVYEDMDGKGFKPYSFLDGVTVFLKTPNDISLGNVERTGKYARIISTTREEYNKIFPNVKTDGLAWLGVVRTEYQKALKADTNNLMLAWAKGRLK